MKKITTLLFCVLVYACSLFAQSPYSAVALPNGTFVDKRIKKDLKLDAQNNTWIAFGTRQFTSSAIYTSKIGLAKFDGTSWTTWNVDNSPLPTNSLTSLEIKGSVVWIGTLSGLVKKNGDSWTVYNTENSGIASDSVYDVSVNGSTVWVATEQGVSRFNGTTWTTYSTATHPIADNKVNTILSDKKGKIWMGTNKGISTLSSGVWNTYNKTNSGLKTDAINTIEQTSTGEIWIGTDSTIGLYAGSSGALYGGLYTIQNGVVVPAYEYSKICNSYGFMNNVYCIAFKGSNPIIPARFLNRENKSQTQFLEFLTNKTTAYKAQISGLSFAGFTTDPLFCSVTPTQQLQWCGDSLYFIDMNAYSDPVWDTTPTMAYLDINKVSTPVLNRGDLFWDTHSGGYEVPKGNCKRALFSSALWIGGVTNNNIHVAAQTYRQSGNDYWPGPITIGTGITDAVTQEKYDRIWRINRQTIEEFKVNFASGAVGNGTYAVPDILLSWPAHGDSVNGYAANLAPFVDVNGDGLYNPMDGDYPKIKGDQMLFWIFNDNGNKHSESQGIPLKFEIHASAYAYTCNDIQDNDSNTALNYTTFIQYEIFNRSTQTYDSIGYGIWTDVELGNYNDDYIGSNPKKNYAYGYNGDEDDEGFIGYGTNPPAIGVAILDNQTGLNHMSGLSYYNNDFSSTGNPSRAEHYWGYLNQRWKDGTPLTYGGNGKGGTDTAHFMFPGNNDLSGRTEWTEATSQTPPGDRRMLSTLMAPTPMLPGDKHIFEYAIVFSRATSGGVVGSVTKLDTDIDKIRNWYANQSFPTCLDLTTGLKNVESKESAVVSVFPNPALDVITLINPQNLFFNHFEIVDITGRVLMSGKPTANIQIQSLATGIYFLKVQSTNQAYSVKFIKE